MIKLLITGRSGYIASSLLSYLKDSYDVTAVGRLNLDLTNSSAVNRWFKNKKFDAVIHTAIAGGHRLYKDDDSIVDLNTSIYNNILDNKEKYDRLINIGSGAEIYDSDTPYGLSKHIIRKSILKTNNCYNVRAYGVFDKNERDTRFIKANLLNYINKKPMVLHQDKKMDFFYMKDFVSIIKHYIHTTTVPKEIDCSYKTSWYLSEILNKINTLSNYSVPILDESRGFHQQDYTGKYTDLNLTYDGFEVGLQHVHQQLLCNK